MNRLLSKEIIKSVDKQLAEEMNLQDLIDEVGESLAQWFLKNVSKNQSILILLGPGNNGEDGKALGKRLQKKDYEVSYVNALEGVVDSAKCDIVVDAVFGISINRLLPESLINLFSNLAKTKQLKIAIDIPSGVDANTGKVWGGAFPANITLTIGVDKPGLYLSPGNESTGKIVKIEVPTLTQYYEKITDTGKLLSWNPNWINKITPTRSDHKYIRGKLVVVMGESFPGASLLAAYAAQKVGVGYVQVLVPEKLLKTCQIEHPSFVFKSYSSVEDLIKLLNEEVADVIAIGCGRTLEALPFSQLISNENNKFVLDGGMLSRELFLGKEIRYHKNVVVTPHAGELKRIADGDTKWEQVINLASHFKGVVVAKGYDTIIYKNTSNYFITEKSSSFLSVAGTGDVLAGIIAGLFAQGLDSIDAAAMGVYLHSHAAEKIQWGLTPQVLIEEVGKSLNELKF